MLNETLVKKFNQYFRVELVTTDKHYEDMFKLRHDVYIEEFKYQDEKEFSNGLEKDEFDDISTACVIYHIATGKPAACVRLIPGKKCDYLPIEKYMIDILDNDVIKGLNKNRSSLAEVSRLAVSREFRRRGKEALSPVGYHDENEEITYPLLSVACFLSCIIISDIIDTEQYIAAMDPFLPRLLKYQNLNFEKISEPASYHGQRCAYLIHKRDALNNISSVTMDFMLTLHRELMS